MATESVLCIAWYDWSYVKFYRQSGALQHWKATEGIDVFNQDHWPRVVEKLNSNEFQALRVAQFKV